MAPLPAAACQAATLKVYSVTRNTSGIRAATDLTVTTDTPPHNYGDVRISPTDDWKYPYVGGVNTVTWRKNGQEYITLARKSGGNDTISTENLAFLLHVIPPLGPNWAAPEMGYGPAAGQNCDVIPYVGPGRPVPDRGEGLKPYVPDQLDGEPAGGAGGG